eukprot:4539343-Pleurochrysis_carterae.AAC.6
MLTLLARRTVRWSGRDIVDDRKIAGDGNHLALSGLGAIGKVRAVLVRDELGSRVARVRRGGARVHHDELRALQRALEALALAGGARVGRRPRSWRRRVPCRGA